MQFPGIRVKVGLDELPSFKIKDADRSKFLKTRLRNRSGTSIFLSDCDVDRIEIALRTLVSLDHHSLDHRHTTDSRVKTVAKAQKPLQGLIDLFQSLEDKQVSHFAICLYMLDREHQDQTLNLDEGREAERIREIFRTIKLIARNPKWFDKVIAGWNTEANHKKQDRWLNLTMDDLCKILADRNVVLARNSHSAPFGLVLDALTLVRPGITAAPIDSYLQITRQGVGRSSFGRRWAEIE